MKLLSMKFDEVEGVPESITVSMSLEEAVAIAALFGRLNGYGLDRLGLRDDGEGPYGCIVGGVLNRYWDGGLDEIGPRKLDLATLNDPPS